MLRNTKRKIASAAASRSSCAHVSTVGEPRAVGELGREHAAGRQLVDHRGHVDERMSGVPVGEQASGCRPRCRSRAPRRGGRAAPRRAASGSKPGNSSPRARNTTSVLTRSARIASSTPGYCTFTATSRPPRVTARCTCPIDAAAIGTGSHSREDALGRVAELLAHDLRGELGRHRRRVLLQRGERVAHRLGQAVVEVARHLAELHQRALELAERGGDVGRGAELVRGVELGAPLRRRGGARARCGRPGGCRCAPRSRRGGRCARPPSCARTAPGRADAAARAGPATTARQATRRRRPPDPDRHRRAHVATVAAGQYT